MSKLLPRLQRRLADFMPIDVYAILTRDGEWTAHGTMGWWGISTNEKPDRSWYDEIAALAKEIQPLVGWGG